MRRSTEHGGSAVRAALAASPSGAQHDAVPHSKKKTFSGAGTLDVTGSGLQHSPYSGKSFTKEAKFDSEAGTFELTGSGLGLSPYSKKSFSEALDVTDCGVEPIPGTSPETSKSAQ